MLERRERLILIHPGGARAAGDAVSFDGAKLLSGLEVITNQLGKKLDEDNSSLHAQLPDGIRLSAVDPTRGAAISSTRDPEIHQP